MGFFGVYTKLHELSINGVKAEDQDDDTVPNTDEDDDTQDPPAGEPTGDDGTDGDNAGDDDTVPTYDDGADEGDDTAASDTMDGPDQTGGDANPDTDDTAQQADTGGVPTYDDGADDTDDNYDIPDGAEPPADRDAPEADSADDAEGRDAGADAGEPTGDDGTDGDNAGDDDTVPSYDGAGDDGADDGTTDTGETDTGDAGGSQIANDLKSMEDEIFADLSDQQKDIRDNELKTQYINLYNVINDAEKRINNITKNEQTGRVLEFITRKMNELKQLIHHNLTKVYITRTYTENQTALQQCIAIMNIICNMLDSIAQEDQKEIGEA